MTAFHCLFKLWVREELHRNEYGVYVARKVIFVPKIIIWAVQYAAAEGTMKDWKNMSYYRQEVADEQILRVQLVCFKTISKSTLTKSRFGYVTNTKIKFIIVVESSNTLLRDNEVRTVRIFIKRDGQL